MHKEVHYKLSLATSCGAGWGPLNAGRWLAGNWVFNASRKARTTGSDSSAVLKLVKLVKER
jgi:hypothetical protein